MSADVMFIAGLVFLIISPLFIISAITDRRWPIVGVVIGALGVLAISTAIARNPAGYSINDIPDIVSRIFAAFAK
ncbi:MAG: hypothetical protein ABI459_01500 [Deltaproteobacteria bacterium]